MATLIEEAKAYQPSQTKNIADLDSVSITQDIKRETRKNSDGEEYSIAFISVEGQEYRVPKSVLEKLQAILKVNPKMTNFKVVKTGEGLKTEYTVVPLN